MFAEDRMPEIYSAIDLVFPYRSCLPDILVELQKYDIPVSAVIEPKLDTTVVLELYQIYYKKSWYLSEVLCEMFAKATGKLEQIKEIAAKFQAKIVIDIAFYQYGTYPALEFLGSNMKNIRFLEADISIDPYCLAVD